MENDTKIRKVLFNEISLSLAVTGVLASAIFWVTNPQQKLELDVVKLQSQLESNETIVLALEKIKNNDLHEIQLRMDKIEERQIQILQAVARLEAIVRK